MTTEDTTQALLKQAIALFEQTSTMLDSLLNKDEDNSLLSQGGNEIDKHQAAELVRKHWKTLAQYREKYWREGIHYFPQPDGSFLYNRMLLKDWLVNWRSQEDHQRAIDYWLSTLPCSQKVSSKRKSSRSKAA
ncbi:MAG: hypothetical protein AAGB19_21425 [Cyanobacteria bacterium P01_F01_bin.3]